MYNANLPSKDELPSSKQLIKSTLLALIVAMVILVTVVLPAEYAIDPTGAGRWLGLTDMGEIKQQLSEEAEADRALAAAEQKQSAEPAPVNNVKAPEAKAVGDENSAVEKQVELKAEPVSSQPEPQAPSQPVWKDEIQFVLTPGQGTEYKLVMNGGAVAQYFWVSEGGPINFDAHGDGRVNGQRRSISYEKGRGVAEDQGDLTATFTGKHGWFFRNRNKHNVTVTLKVKGDYSELKKLI